MIRYTMRFSDALQAYFRYVTTGQDAINFVDPILNQFYLDQEAGLCTIQFQAPDSTTDMNSNLEIHYIDPELEFQRRLAI